MKCTSCEVEIDPKWKHALKNNICPSCGEAIMPEDLKNYIANLDVTFNDLVREYPEQLDDWLYSNFNYVKVNSNRFNDMMPRQKASMQREDEEYQDESLLSVQPQEVTSKFFKNAEVSKTVSRTEELKRMVSDIKSKNPQLAARQTMQLLQEEDSFDENDDLIEVNSSLDNGQDNDEKIPAAVLAFANRKATPGNHDYNAKDMMRLQQMRDRTIEARDNVINGTGGKGSFSRG